MVGLEIEYKSPKGEVIKATIPFVLPAGSYPTPNVTPTTQDAAAAEDKALREWLIESGLIRVEGEPDKITPADQIQQIVQKAKDYFVGSKYLIPTIINNQDKLQLFSRFFTLTNLIQDLFTNKENMASLTKDKATKLQGLLIGGEIFEGKMKSLDDLPKGIPIPEDFKTIIQSFFNITTSAQELIFDFTNISKPLATKTNESFTGVGIFLTNYFITKESKDGKGIAIPDETYDLTHVYACGVESLLEFSALIAGISISDASIRSHVLFNRCVYLAAAIVDGLVDLFGLTRAMEKEVELEGNIIIPNLILHKARNANGDLKIAFQKHTANLTNNIQNFVTICTLLRKTFPKNKRLDKFLSVFETFIDGAIYWKSTSARDFKTKVVQNEE